MRTRNKTRISQKLRRWIRFPFDALLAGNHAVSFEPKDQHQGSANLISKPRVRCHVIACSTWNPTPNKRVVLLPFCAVRALCPEQPPRKCPKMRDKITIPNKGRANSPDTHLLPVPPKPRMRIRIHLRKTVQQNPWAILGGRGGDHKCPQHVAVGCDSLAWESLQWLGGPLKCQFGRFGHGGHGSCANL